MPIGNDEDRAATAVLDAKTGSVQAIGQNTTYAVQAGQPWRDCGQLGGRLPLRRQHRVLLRVDGQDLLVTALKRAGRHEQRLCQGQPEQGSRIHEQGDPRSLRARRRHVVSPGDLNFPGASRWRRATAQSISTAFVGMTIQLGGDPCKIGTPGGAWGCIGAMARRSSTRRRSSWAPWSASPMTMATSVYQTIANGERLHHPRAGDVDHRDGKALRSLWAARIERVDPGGPRRDQPAARGPGQRRHRRQLAAGRWPPWPAEPTERRMARTKTWFDGYLPRNCSTAVWVGTPDDEERSRVLSVSACGR